MDVMNLPLPHGTKIPLGIRRLIWFCAAIIFMAILETGCAHYSINHPLQQCDPACGYRGGHMGIPGNSESLVLFLTFSAGGTRAAAFSYGVLEELKKTEVTIDGERCRLLDEVDGISGVSGGSFTAAYYGLFGNRIFQEFESRFLKKDIQGALAKRTLLNPLNWIRLASPYFGRSDLAAEYYDKYVFDGATFRDMAARKGPMIFINATDMTLGTRVSFTQDLFDMLCSDLSSFPVARACAASSAVPVVLSPITLRNYAGSCGYKMLEPLKRAMSRDFVSSRRFDLANNMLPFLDSEKKPYIHLVDGGVADNLGLRPALEGIILLGDFWETLKFVGLENIHKVVFIVVNAETELDPKWDQSRSMPPVGAMLKSYASTVISRYNAETVALLRESFDRWTDEVRSQRCPSGKVSTEPGSCGDIKFYLIEVKFDALGDETERTYFKRLPTTFKLSSEEVDKLRDAAHRILIQSKEFQGLLRDLK